MTSDRAWTSTFPGSVTGVVGAAEWIEALSKAEGFPEDLTFGIQLCVEELFTNTVRHGGGAWPEGATDQTSPITMTIVITRAPDEVTVVLEDDARPFDVAAAPAKPVGSSLEDAQPGGLGIQLIKTFASELTYDRVNGLNRTTLKFLWPQSEFSLL